ncbi:hypothetical protein [Dictyobacter aurantiacus]|uniref:SWIM-type domain-containing protein n=1 Tax=Dictyobacter aurantiacus TaxID=1936993 RepID=A0A401ZCY2_9CHLR|nr:hypothetical protein [Dictyobacter aurantiacus]GCE04705.1 hypothetical protein KDAU_20340 [Dictyobacter aurantiacus]
MATTTKTSPITEQQINRCTRIIDMQTMEPFYLVQSEADDLIEYKVQYHKDPKCPGKGHFTCTCPAGLDGFIHCSGPYCKHIRWALAASQVHKAELKAQAQAKKDASPARSHLLITDGQEADEETYTRVISAKPPQWTEAEIQRDVRLYASRPFKMWR